MRTRAEWDDAVPGFLEIDLAGREGGNSKREFCFTLDITDGATGWTETRSVKNKAQKWVFVSIKEAAAAFSFPFREQKRRRSCEEKDLAHRPPDRGISPL
ncbi:hypothetical protein [Arthrobacter alpinus]|uniref:hypothetical protein n=1 Tax=Arthrobacter alpinus TaxID=656366 RepID=UPI000781FCD1|nr:hypothetical protein [Arthrobacter alpinus]